MTVYKKLQQAKKMLQAVDMKKSGHNKFAGYYYFELGDFLPHVVRIFDEVGLCSCVSFGKELAELRIIDTEDNSLAVFSSPMAGAALKGCHEIQNLGAVQTYQRRYLYVMALDIVEHDAIDSAEPVKPAPAKPAQVERKSAKSVTLDVWDSLPEDEKEFLQGIAMEVLSCETPAEMLNVIESHKLDAEEKIALWSRFDSKTRAALRSAGKPSLGEQA